MRAHFYIRLFEALVIAYSVWNIATIFMTEDITKPTHYTGVGHDPLIGHPISMNCRAAYTVLCPEHHGD